MNRDGASISTQLSGASGDWLEHLGRAGYVTKGIVYAMIGVLALRAAMGSGGSTEGTRGAILEIADQPFGQVLLVLTAVGLFGYALWRFVEALLDPQRAGKDAEGIIKRIGIAASGMIYLGLSIWSAGIVLAGGSGQGSEGNSQQRWTGELMAQPLGRWLVAAVGAIVVAVGVYHLYRAYRAAFMKHYDVRAMSGRQRRWVRRVGRIGISARGVTFGIIGVFLIQAAVQFDPSEARGLSGALQALASQPYGPWLLGTVALGFVAYGIHCISRARYSRFSMP